MKAMHLLAAALLAAGGLAMSNPAEAAPRGGPSVTALSGDVILAGHRDRDGDRDWRRHRRGDDDDWRRGRRGDDWRNDGWRGDNRGKHKGGIRGRSHDRHWDRNDRKDWAKERRKWEKERRKWVKERRKQRAKQQRRWGWRHHPRQGHWRGRPFRHDRHSRIRDHGDYRLPPPWRGQFYARSGNDVFLVDEATRQIVDAFVLYNLLGR